MLYMGNRISSKENRIYKECTRLARKKYRDREGRYLIEGENLIREAILCGEKIEYLLVRDGASFDELTGNDHYVLDSSLFDGLAQTETSQGILGVVRKRGWDQDDLAKLPSGSNLVVLDRLQDPGNIGTIIRTAEGAGYGAVLCMKGTGDVYSPKVVRAAAGSLFRMPVIQVEDPAELTELLHRFGKKLAVTCIGDDTVYYRAGLSEDVALVIGNEGNGCSSEMIAAADIRVSIPMKGRLESLNASVAAGILMYEAMRR